MNTDKRSPEEHGSPGASFRGAGKRMANSQDIDFVYLFVVFHFDC